MKDFLKSLQQDRDLLRRGQPVSLLGKAVPLQLHIKPSAAQMFPTSGSAGGLPVGSRMLGFKDVNSRSEGTQWIQSVSCLSVVAATEAVSNRSTHLASIRTAAVKVQRGFSCVNEITSHISLVKTCPLPQISSVTLPLSHRQFQKSEYKKHRAFLLLPTKYIDTFYTNKS